MAHMHPQPSKPSCACIVDQPQTKGSELQRARSAQIFGQHEVHLDQVQQSSTVQQVPCDAMSALVSTVQLRCPRECHHAHGNVDGRVRRAPRREHVKSSCARTPWPILMVNSAIFRAERYQDDGMDGALPSGARGGVHTLGE